LRDGEPDPIDTLLTAQLGSVNKQAARKDFTNQQGLDR
jgi:hypothetical protein